MPRTNKTLTNTVGGELAPSMYSRIDLPIYQKGLEKCENFVTQPQGGADFRCGSMFVKYTRLNRTGILIPFQFNDSQSYLVEATEFKFRFYKDNSVITESAKTITGITQANPGVVTSNSHGFSNGDEVYISGVLGMSELNGKFFIVAGAAANTFTLTDVFGNAVNTSAYTAYSSAGSVARVYEISTPYHEADIPGLQWTQNADTMYITHRNYEPRKLTRSAHTTWTLATYSRTADPFTPATHTISAITQANPGVITTGAHSLVTGDVVRITGIVGMTQLNNLNYSVVVISSTTFSLLDPNGVAVDTTSYTAYSSGGTVTNADEWPRACAFSDTGRLIFGGTKDNPETIFASKAPSTAGVVAFDDFTTGSGATDAVVFTLAPILGKVDAIQWLANTSKFVIVGTFGTIRRLYGGTEQEAISPAGVTAKSVNAYGCATSLPVANGESLFYLQRGTKYLRSLAYDIAQEGYVTTDRNLVADHIATDGLKQIIEQQGRPDVIWGVRNNGRLVGLTYKEKEDISGWHRHYLAGAHINSSSITMGYGKVLWVGPMPRTTNADQLWLIVERRINSQTVRSVEYLADKPVYPVRADFDYANDGDEDEDNTLESLDTTKFLNASYEKQKDAVHMDMVVSYDGSVLQNVSTGAVASATLTPGAVTGSGITFTASAPVFTSAMVGRRLWKKYDENGDGGGRATITGFTDSTHVVCEITSAFDSVSAIPSGSWFLTASSLSGLDHLEGQTVGVVVDGGPHSDEVVASGAISLDSGYHASKIHVGLKYRGTVKTLNLDTGGVTGSAATKVRNILKASLRFLNTLGPYFGSTVYERDTGSSLERQIFRDAATSMTDRPTALFSGVKDQTYFDAWEEEKHACLVQRQPLPCTILSMDLFFDTTDE